MGKEQSQNRWFAEKRAEWQSCLGVSVKLSLHSLKVSVAQGKIAIQPKKRGSSLQAADEREYDEKGRPPPSLSEN
jgi:hypothetical protein